MSPPLFVIAGIWISLVGGATVLVIHLVLRKRLTKVMGFTYWVPLLLALYSLVTSLMLYAKYYVGLTHVLGVPLGLFKVSVVGYCYLQLSV